MNATLGCAWGMGLIVWKIGRGNTMSDDARKEDSAARQRGPLRGKIAYGKGLVVPYRLAESNEPVLMGVSLGQYVSNGNLCVGLGIYYDGEGKVVPFFNITRNISELPYCCCAIDVEGNGAGILDTLEECGLGGRLDGLYLEDRGVRYPLFAFDPLALMDAKSLGFDRYREAHGFASPDEGLVADTDGIERIAHGALNEFQPVDGFQKLDDALGKAKRRAAEKKAELTPSGLEGKHPDRER